VYENKTNSISIYRISLPATFIIEFSNDIGEDIGTMVNFLATVK
jgi:hypothetical protein